MDKEVMCGYERRWNKGLLLLSYADIYLLLLVLFSLTTLFQALFESISINRIIGAMIALLSLVLIVDYGPIKKIPFFLLILIGNAIFSCLFSLNLKEEVVDWIYFLSTILILQVMSKDNNVIALNRSFVRFSKLIAIVINLECSVIFLFLLLHIGFTNKWGEGEYFVGLCNGEHTMGSLCCLILAFILSYCRIYTKLCKWYVFLSLVLLYALFETGARVFIIPAVVLLFLLIKSVINNRILRRIIYICCSVILLIMLLKSSMMDKFIFVLNNIYAKDLWDSFTSGRSEFWVTDLQYFISGNIIQILFGRTFSHIYYINRNVFGVAIWSHNDIIQLLNATGLTGTVIYILQLKKIFGILRRREKERFLYFLVCLYLVVPMMMNGFFIYQHFVYSFILLYCSLLLSEGEMKNEDWYSNIS